MDNGFWISPSPSVTAQLPFPVSPLPFFAITCGPRIRFLKIPRSWRCALLKDTIAVGRKFMDNGSSWGRKEEEKRAERVLWPKEVRAHAHLYLSMHDTTTVASVMYEVRTKKRRFVRRINTGISVTDNIPTKECSFQPTYSLPYWQDTKNYRDDRATNSSVDDGGKRIERTITKRFMKLT